MVLDREDNNKGYHPGNCRWVTQKTNMNNRKDTVKVSLGGVTKTASEWAAELGIQRQTICWRYRRGWTPEEILRV